MEHVQNSASRYVNSDIGRYSKKLVQYFWDPAPQNEEEADIWLLGEKYDAKQKPIITTTTPTTGAARRKSSSSSASKPDSVVPSDSDVTGSESEHVEDVEDESWLKVPNAWPPPFLDDFESRFWMTYRSGFPLIAKSKDPKATSGMSLAMRFKTQLASPEGFTSDTGFGCMIRSGQSLLANTLSALRFGRDWRRGPNVDEEKSLVSLFADDPKAPFSIHRFIEHGAAACGKYPGEWFGPSATARCIKALCDDYPEAGLRVYCTEDSPDVYEDTFSRIAEDSNGKFTPTLILLGIRLGIDRITPVYWEALKYALQSSQSVGIAGGRPSASHYFVGTQGSHFFFLDPHTTRPALPLHTNPKDYTIEELDSVHTRRLRRIAIAEMDPSMLIGFLVRDRDDWETWKVSVAAVQGKPIVHVAEFEPSASRSESERQEAIDEVASFDDDDGTDTVC